MPIILAFSRLNLFFILCANEVSLYLIRLDSIFLYVLKVLACYSTNNPSFLVTFRADFRFLLKQILRLILAIYLLRFLGWPGCNLYDISYWVIRTCYTYNRCQYIQYLLKWFCLACYSFYELINPESIYDLICFRIPNFYVIFN